MTGILHPIQPVAADIPPRNFEAETLDSKDNIITVGTGWLPEFPDLRDYTEQSKDIPLMANELHLSAAQTQAPSQVDLRAWCSPIENQSNLGSCTAHAAVGMVEYYQRRAFNEFIDGSRLFVYKTTRNLLGWRGDTGAYCRTTMAALAMCGVPPERFWPYTTVQNPGQAGDRTFDDEPGSFVYSLADNYEALRYFRHDPVGTDRNTTLNRVKAWLAAGVPAMFGFYGFNSFNRTNVPGGIPYPCPGEAAQWGHAILAVGYDDAFEITNTQCNKVTRGALLIRNSWGAGWGSQGYGWLPYEYVLQGLASDFWSMLSMNWVNTQQFGL
ncbi:C1 family peptidase [Egbenema bharatensis]|uniref:C1 family peptidase n=1 Tax=Egbenema bharatensis TaxID=3463334 RepID=UPI003A862B99